MNISTWIAIYLPFFILLFIILPQQNVVNKLLTVKKRKKKGLIFIMNELLKKHKGKTCLVSTGSFGFNIIGKVIEVDENWVEIETKKGVELINSEFIQRVKILNK